MEALLQPMQCHNAINITGGDGDFYHLEQGSVSLLEVVLHGLLAPVRDEDTAMADAGECSKDCSLCRGVCARLIIPQDAALRMQLLPCLQPPTHANRTLPYVQIAGGSETPVGTPAPLARAGSGMSVSSSGTGSRLSPALRPHCRCGTVICMPGETVG